MKAAGFMEYGGPEVVRLLVVPTPQPGPGEVLVRVRTCGLNYIDLWVRRWPGGQVSPLLGGYRCSRRRGRNRFWPGGFYT